MSAPRELERLFALCRDRGWALIADEVFADYPLDADAPVTDIAAQAGRAVVHAGRPVEVGRPAAGEARLDGRRRSAAASATRRLPALELIADSFLSVSTPVQVARRRSARTRRGDPRRDSRARARESARRFATGRDVIPGVRRAAGRGRMVGGHPRARDAHARKSSCSTCSSAKRVLVHPGYFFDFPHEAFIVVSLLPPPTASFRRDATCAALSQSREAFVTGTPHDACRRSADHAAPGFWSRSSRFPRRAAGASARSATSRRSRAGSTRAGQRLLQLLPINEMPPGETSPYSALSAMAIDPQFITLDHVEDFAAIGGEAGARARAARAPRRGARRAAHRLRRGARR